MVIQSLHPLLVVFWLCAALLAGHDACAIAQVKASADTPPIMQLQALPDGEILALTPERGGLYRSEGSGRKWARVPGVPDAFIHQISVLPDGVVFLSTPEGLLRGGEQEGLWEQVLQGSVAGMQAGPDGGLALVKLWGRGVFVLPTGALSTDAVRQAREAELRRQGLQVKAGEFMRAMRDADGGDNATTEELQKKLRTYRLWQETQEEIKAAGRATAQYALAEEGGLARMPVTCAAATPGNVWLAGTFGHGVYRSDPTGDAWESFSTSLPSPLVVSLATAPWGTVYAGTYGAGLFALRPGGSSWEEVHPHFAGTIVQALAFGPEGQCLAATRGHGVLLSLDRGASWTGKNEILPETNVQAVAVGQDGALWAGTWDQGLYLSRNFGAAWDYRPFAHEFHVSDIVFAGEGVGYAILAGHGLFRTIDDGRGWIRLRMPVPSAKNLRLAVQGKLVLLASPVDGLWVSPDKGATWARHMQGLAGDGALDVVLSPAGVLLAVPSDASGLFERSAAGEWRLVPMAGEDTLDYSVRMVIFLPDGRGVACGQQDLLLSEEGGENWSRKRFGQPFKSLAVDSRGTIHTRRLLSTFVLHTGTDTWKETSETPLDAYVFFHPAGEGLWAGARQDSGLDILAVRDGDMEVVASGLAASRIVALGVSGDGGIFAALEGGLAVSRDGGATWLPVEVLGE